MTALLFVPDGLFGSQLAELLNTTKELLARGVNICFTEQSVLQDASRNDRTMTKLRGLGSKQLTCP